MTSDFLIEEHQISKKNKTLTCGKKTSKNQK